MNDNRQFQAVGDGAAMSPLQEMARFDPNTHDKDMTKTIINDTVVRSMQKHRVEKARL